MAARLRLVPLPKSTGSRSSLSDIGERAGRLSVEIADMAGLIGDLTTLGQTQSQRAQGAKAAAEQMTETNAALSASMAAARASASRPEHPAWYRCENGATPPCESGARKLLHINETAPDNAG